MIKIPASKFFFFLLICLLFSVRCTNEQVYIRCFVTSWSDDNQAVSLTYADNRISSKTSTSLDNGNTITSKVTYSYDGKGNVYKAEEESGSYSVYTYNTNNQLVKEEQFSASAIALYTWGYEYNIYGQLIKVQSYSVSTGTLVKAGFITYEYASTSTVNASKKNSYRADGTLIGTNTYTFDDKKAIFSGLGLNFALIGVPADNNITKNVYKDSAGNTVTETYTYLYNTNGYPTKAAYSSVSSNNDAETALETYTYDCQQ